MRRLGVFIGCFLIAVTCFAVDKGAYYRDFWNPRFQGAIVSYCTQDGKICGSKIASEYCQLMGYLRADKYIKAWNTGLTHFIDTPRVCTGWTCHGFKKIRCVGENRHKPPKAAYYRLRHYVYPRMDHYRVAACKEGKTQCGRSAAQSFCRRMGFESVHRFKIVAGVPATKTLGNQQLCFGKTCKAFAWIDCFR